jgi:hypothetical protein
MDPQPSITNCATEKRREDKRGKKGDPIQ